MPNSGAMGWVTGWISVVIFILTWLVVAIWLEPHMTPAFYSKLADIYPVLLVAVALQGRLFAFTDPDRQSPIASLALFVYIVMGGGATLIAIGDPSTADACLPYAVAGVVAMLAATALTAIFTSESDRAQ